MSVISVDSQRLIIDEQQHYSRPASRDPWAPPSTFEAKSYDYDSSSWSPPPPTTTSSEKKKITHEVAIQCELPIPVVKPASTDAFTQCCNIGFYLVVLIITKVLILALSQPANNRHMLSVDTFEKKIKQRRHNEAKRDGLDARLSQIKKWMDQGEIF